MQVRTGSSWSRSPLLHDITNPYLLNSVQVRHNPDLLSPLAYFELHIGPYAFRDLNESSYATRHTNTHTRQPVVAENILPTITRNGPHFHHRIFTPPTSCSGKGYSPHVDGRPRARRGEARRRPHIFMYLLCIILLASHEGEPGSIPGRVTPGFSQLGIMLDDAAGRRVFSGIFRFPCPFIPVLLHPHLASPSSALKTSMLRAAKSLHSLSHARLPPRRTGFNSRRVTGFLQVRIVPDDAVGRRVFSGISCFPRPLIPVPLHIHFNHPHRLSRPDCYKPPKSLQFSCVFLVFILPCDDKIEVLLTR
ncbi:hypothetical protein PR048_025303 [Dryococelus australis]|uniref:Uncharacterized protein n=1 Tax=Dryococelus australis TaxID=614101 RepID=A0ABQ9GR36_9NEOP|nr:hypothetical protein PR048_025303 [Dryococelus australis]